MTNFEIIAKAFRHNTGAHFLDSGSAYGRHHENPPIGKDDPIVKIECYEKEVLATIETAHLLAATCEVDIDLQDRFDEWVALEENSELTWFEAGEQFSKKVLGLHRQARDNTYNGEHDLSQDYVWEVYTEEKYPSDWIFVDDALLVVYAHTGCDVRGGYAYPLFLRCQGDYSIPIDLVAEFYVEEGTMDGKELEDHEIRELDESWSCGYSSHPSYELSKDIEEVFVDTATVDTVKVKLKTGEIVKIVASVRID
jgi:hypothetical protein